jgi:hypothetical protein
MKKVDGTAQKVKMMYLFLLIHLNAFLFERSSLFWDVTQRGLVVMYRRFGTTHIPHFQRQAVQEEALLELLDP